jgi:hypothetical protein
MRIKNKLAGAFFLAVCFLPQSLFACDLSHGFKLATNRVEYERVETVDAEERRSTDGSTWKILYDDKDHIVAIVLTDAGEADAGVTRYTKFKDGLAINIYHVQFYSAYNVKPANPSTDFAVACGDQIYFGTPMKEKYFWADPRDVKGEYESIKDLVDVISRSKEIQPFFKKLLVQ